MRLDAAIDLFLGSYQNALTRETYQKALNQLVDQLGPGRDITGIQPADMIHVYNYFLNMGYATATFAQRVKTVKTFFRWLHNMELIESNPARVIKTPRIPRPQTKGKAMTDAELQLILGYAKFRNRRDYALFMFFADTGCRADGAANLKTSDIDWDKREAVVTEKGGKTRKVKFGTETANVLRRYILWRKAIRGPYVFSKDGSPIQADTLSQRVRRACEGLRKQGHEIRILYAHSMRHRKGHQFSTARIAPSIAASALGHESVLTTLQHYYPDDWESAASALDELSLKSDEKSS